jgi:molybdopterin molybdotransferase
MSAAPSSTGLLAIDDALAAIEAQVSPTAIEQVPLEHAAGRYLAEQLRATLDLPPFDSSAMDGFAIRAGDVPGRLRVVGESAAGSPYGQLLGGGEAVAISTGAVVPVGADAVVPIEDVTVAGDAVEVGAVPVGEFVRETGSDVRRGQPLLCTGIRIAPAQLGAAAAVGLRTLPCRRLPRVAILTTGTELREPGELLAEGQIFDANGPMLRAALHSAGAVIEMIPAAADTAEQHRAALAHALEHDVVITSGGVSVGAHDLVRDVAAELGVRELFWRIALRPGKPLSFGVRERAKGPLTLVFGLPGNPVSTLVCFELFVRPALLKAQGAREFRPAFRHGALAVPVRQNPQRDDLIRVRVQAGADRPALTPVPGQQSHQIAIAAGADALARIPAGTAELPAGADVSYLPLHG